MGRSWKKSLAIKLLWIIVAAVILYFIGIGLQMMPVVVIDTIDWFADRFEWFVFLICFLAICAVAYQVAKRRGSEKSY